MEWDIWGIIIGLIGSGFIGGLLVYLTIRWQRQRKELSYRVEITPLLTRHRKDTLPPEVQILYQGEEVWDLYSFKITFRNMGNMPLTDLPITVELGQNARILSIATTIPNGIEVGNLAEDEASGSNKAGVKLAFLNEGDQIDLSIISADNVPLAYTIKAPLPGLRPKERPQLWTRRELWGRLLRESWMPIIQGIVLVAATAGLIATIISLFD